ncbi:MAG: hypothetical protein ABEH59_04590, partial [Halobacteriales archaeon]
MGLLDRAEQSEPADESPATSEQPSDGTLEQEPSDSQSAAGPDYIDYDRTNPPQAVRQQFGQEGGVDANVLDVLETYVTERGTIREELLEFTIDQLEEWAEVEATVGQAKALGNELADLVEERTVDVPEDLPEDEFFSNEDGFATVTNRYDLEKAVPLEKKQHFEEVERYWVDKPYTFAIIFHSSKGNEKKYYVIEPYLNPEEEEILEFLSEKLRVAIKYESDDVLAAEREDEDAKRAQVLDQETRRLLARFDLYADANDGGDSSGGGWLRQRLHAVSSRVGVDLDGEEPEPSELDGLSVRPEPAVLEEGTSELTEYQFEKLRHRVKRDFVGYERIDGI